MPQQFAKGTTYTDNAPGNIVTATNLNSLVDQGTLLVGAITSQTELADPVADNDFLLVADTSDIATSAPKKLQAQNLLPESVRNGSKQYAGGSQTGSVYAVTLAPAATAYATGMRVVFLADSANTGAVSVNVNALGPKNIFTRALVALAANDILNGQIVDLVYDGTRFIMLNALSAAEVTATHQTEAARSGINQYIADSGVAANVYAATLAPAATVYTAGMVVRFKAANTNTGASTLNVNALGAKNIKKRNGADPSANDILANQIVEVVYDGTNFQLVVAGGWEFVGTAAVPAGSAVAAIAHGLGALPTRWRAVLKQNNASAQQGYAQNDEVALESTENSSNGNMAFASSADATNITIARVNVGNISIIPKTGGAVNAITDANWLVKVYASL